MQDEEATSPSVTGHTNETENSSCDFHIIQPVENVRI